MGQVVDPVVHWLGGSNCACVQEVGVVPGLQFFYLLSLVSAILAAIAHFKVFWLSV